MKKLFKFIIFILIVLGLCAFFYYAYRSNFFGLFSKSDDSKPVETTNEKETTPTIDYSKFPDSWNNLFDIQNATITYSSAFMGGNSGTYKIVDNKYYFYNNETSKFEETSSIYVFKYQGYFDSFTFDDLTSTYSALNLSLDETVWVEDIEIKIVDGRIKTIISDNHQASLHIVTTYTFSDYGVTIIE